MNRKRIFLLVSGLLLVSPLLLSHWVSAKDSHSLEQIIALNETPPGVVIEIVTGDSKGLSWALPKSQQIIAQLRKRFPGLPVAVVTHGKEQFALQTSKQAEQKEVHQNVKSLIGNDVQVHVCGTYAGWRGLSEEDFPDYVNVAAAGPAQINDYIAVGYLLLVIKTPQ